MSSSSSRRATNLSLDAELLSEARRLDINLSRAAEAGIRAAISDVLSERWRIEEG
ncbi:type II toxin-antitoxin system CcdA family antitoxin, partial [Aestuariivita boseongensis]|uniref:type II toxin-antitoxin system CcdA family antitoxin n=1 Tax=Aestuariivita boseongensis TaxID=1470562 RepID=UPI0009E5EFF3